LLLLTGPLVNTPLTGIFPPLVTPLTDRDTLDVAGLECLTEHVLSGGVHGLFLLGTTGEGPSLSQRLKTEVVERGCRLVAGRVPVMVGVTDPSFVDALTLARRASDVGADAVVIAPPYYLPLSQPELAGYVERFATASPLPVLLYHIPSLTGVGFAPETIRRLLDTPKVIGLKDSGRDMTYQHTVRSIVSDRHDFSLLVGPEELLAEAVLLGAHGAMCGGANMVPHLYVDLYHGARAGDLPRVRELHDRIIKISDAIYSVGSAGSSYLLGLKCALAHLGLCDGCPAEPYVRFSPAERETVRERLRQVGLLVD
jgi:dihydrodipicolinate synthase/N-acetylneuraminate lyase